MSRTDPYLSFSFQVEINSILVGGFAEVSGIELEVEPEQYEEGGVNEYTHQLPGRVRYPNLVLKRGLTDYDGLWGWIRNATDETKSGSKVRRTVTVSLLDANRKRTWAWQFKNAYPVKWTGPELRAEEGTVAIETLELTHTGITKLGGTSGL